MSGVCQAWVNVTDADHGFARVADSQFVLESTESGPVQIVWKPTGTGEKDCIVLLRGSGQRWLVALADGPQCGGATMTIKDVVPDDEFGMPSPVPTVVLNPHGLFCLDNDELTIRWSFARDDWMVLQVDHHPLTVIRGNRVQGLDLQENRRIIAAQFCTTADDWHTWHRGTRCQSGS